MNILFYIDRYPGIGGIENVSSIIIKKLCIAHNVFLISNTQQDGILYPEFVRLFAMPDNTDERSSQNLSFLLSVIKDYKIEAVIYQDSYGQTDTNLCKAVDKTQVPLYVFEHNSPLFIYNKRDLDPITSLKGLIRRILHPYLLQKEIKRKRNLLSHSRKYVLLSKQFIPELCKLIGADENDKRITYINNPILPASGDDKIFKENIILCVSRLAKEKCVDKMINMWSSLAHQLPDWKFLIVGDGPERQKLECIVKDLQVPRVEFIGYAKPTVYYQKAKIFWMTSKFEGWGMTLIEAMQQSCIPIALETYSSIRDIIDNGRTGYLVDPKNLDKFIDYTMLLANDDTHRTILGDLAKKKTEEFSVDRIMAEWNKLLELIPKLLQIDSCLGILSTGKITENIAKLAMDRGWDCHIMHGARCVDKTVQNHYQVSSLIGEYLHYAESLLFDRHGLGSRLATKRIIAKIKEIQPDIIQLHCVHGYYINYKYLFEYLNTTNIPIVWTFHDCWAFTGHCAHFVTANCNKWKEEGCHDCQLLGDYPKALTDRSSKNFKLKKDLFSANKNLHLVAVSEWLASLAKESFLGDKDIRVINNGINIQRFHPCAEKSLSKFKILGVASAWNKDKGLFDFYNLRDYLPLENFDITLVGLTQEQVSQLPFGIKGITRTNSIEELAQLYSEANVFVNPTYADSFPTVNVEALACGTPVITYRTGGSPEIIDKQTGYIINQGDVPSLVNAIMSLKNHSLSAAACRERAERLYNKDDRFMDYIKLYEELIKNR